MNLFVKYQMVQISFVNFQLTKCRLAHYYYACNFIPIMSDHLSIAKAQPSHQLLSCSLYELNIMSLTTQQNMAGIVDICVIFTKQQTTTYHT